MNAADFHTATDSPVMLNGVAWLIVITDGPLIVSGKRVCATFNRNNHTITIDRGTPTPLMPYAVAKAIEQAIETKRNEHDEY